MGGSACLLLPGCSKALSELDGFGVLTAGGDTSIGRVTLINHVFLKDPGFSDDLIGW